ncbi:hypothetical protein [Ornithinimicrobium sediminis]|uniref:hypothetical protein n=1 Tax=Ornithinimicrobium sediminis TaxID=2904603 RepID=UPI001E3F9496|nr:hypothetical protein [Ornithinimicrobium sediminis]MCE0487190.1 hypothetical protein [Ornithinimicrobium sediminis]
MSGSGDPPAGGAAWLWHHFSTFALYVFWVSSLLAVPVVMVHVGEGRVAAPTAVLGAGLLAPVVAWAIGVHIGRVAGQQEHRWWWRLTQWPRRLRHEPLGERAWVRWQRAYGVGLAVGVTALAGALLLGSMAGALLAPPALWTAVFARLRRSAPPA